MRTQFRASILGAGVTILFLFALGAGAQCVSCGNDFDAGCLGYGNSGNGIHCTKICQCGLVTKSYLDTLHPGFFLADREGKRIVESVIPGSPAEKSGLRPNDVIVSINGGSKPSCDQAWAQSSANPVVSLVVQRGASTRTITVGLVPIRTYFTQAGILPSNPGIKKVDFRREMGLSAAFHALAR